MTILRGRLFVMNFPLIALLGWMVFPTVEESVHADDKKSLAEQLPRIPAVEPKDALKTFKLQHGFRLELVASEPAVSDPVDACFDENGRMYVAEMHGYPYSDEPRPQCPEGRGKSNAGIIRLLEDTNGDGRMDRSVRFADDITWPTSVCCYHGGVFVIAPPHLHYFKDTDGDDVADVREIVYSGFSRANVQGLANNMKWGLENWIYAAGGPNGADLKHRGEPLLNLGRRDIRFNPKTEQLEPISGGRQFGHSMDDWGNRFVCRNSNHIQHVVFPHRYLKRNPYFAVSGVVQSIAKEGRAAPVFRRSIAEPWRVVRTRRRVADPNTRLPPTELVPVGFFTSATGVTIYRGGAYPARFRGNAFIGDVGGNLVHRKIVRPNGASFTAARADRHTEFVASTDNWFRPTNFVNAPDGTLYILDMYRETIEHPASIPPDIKRYLDLEGGNDRGRIYRLVSPNMKRIRPPKLGQVATAELVSQLESPNIWNRQTAQRLIWERQDKSAVRPLGKLIRHSQSPLARLHALYTLDGLQSLTPELVLQALKDAHPGVREHAVRLSEEFVNSSPKLFDALVPLADDATYRVRYQLAYTLGEVKDDTAVAALARLARNKSNDANFRIALMTSVSEKADRLAIELMNDADFLQQSTSSAWLTDLTQIAGANKNPQPSIRLLAAATDSRRPPAVQLLVIQALGEGLNRRGSSMSKLLAEKGTDDKVRNQVQTLFQSACEVAADPKRSIAERNSAIGLLAFSDSKTAVKTLHELLSPQAAQSLQLAAVRALSNHRDAHLGELLLSQWRSYSPSVRREVVDIMLRSAARIDALFAAVDSKQIQRGDIERNKKQILLNHTNDKIRTRARKLFGSETSTDRAKVVAAHQKVLQLNGDAERGKQLFQKKCSICHRVGNVGHQVAPDLASAQNKSPADLLIAILDPNREAQPNFMTYTLATQQGKLFNGIIATETATSVTLRRAEGKQDVVLRSNIDKLVSNGKSLMPEGFEKDITPIQMADLIAFVRSIKPSNPKSQ